MATIVALKYNTRSEGAKGGKKTRKKFKAIVRRASLGVPLLTKTFTSEGDAAAWARKTESEIERGLWLDTGKASSTRLGEALATYKTEVTPRKRSASSELSALHIIEEDAGALALLDLALPRLTGADFARLRDKWKRDGVKPSTIRRRMAILSHLYTIARKEWRMIGLHNPIGDVALPRVADARSRRTSNDEVTAICAATESKELADFLRLALATTMRRGELHALRWENVDLDGRIARLPPEVTKSLKGRNVPLSKTAITVLKGIGPRKSGPVFHYDPHTYTRAWRRAATRARDQYLDDCEKRGVEPDPHFLVDAKLHDLRHEGASRYAEKKKFNTLELAAITGHQDLRMLKRYVHPDARELAKRMG